jgi:hypothetical protein
VTRRLFSRAGGSLTLIIAGSLLAAGCSSPKPHRLGAAEPAMSPPAQATPAGVLVKVGLGPEGIAYDAQTRLLAVAVRRPDRLQLLDPRSLAERRVVALPGSVRHLQVAAPGGPVLVPAESAGELVQVPLVSGPPVVVTRVGRQPHDATGAGAGEVVVGNELSGSISVLRAGSVVRTFTDLKQPGGVIGDGTTVAVVDVGAFTVSTYDLATLTRRAVIAAGQGPTHGVLTSGHRLVVVDTRGNALLTFGLDPLRLLGRLALPGVPYGIASDPVTSTVWVTLTATNELVGVDVSGANPRVIARYPTVRQPNSVAVAPGSRTVWVTGTYSGVVERVSR